MDTLPQNTPQKQCTKCKDFFPATTEFFYRNKRNKDGLQFQCKVCRQIYQKAYRSNPEVHEHILAQQKTHRNLPEIQEQERTRRKAYYRTLGYQERNRARARSFRNSPEGQVYVKAYRKSYYHSPEGQSRIQAYWRRPEVQERTRTRMKAHYHTPLGREKVQAYHRRPETKRLDITRVRNRNARKKAIPGTHTPAQIQDLLKRQHYRCYYAACGHAKFEKRNGKYVYHVDHTFPVSRVVGSDIPANDISYLVLACPACNISKKDKFPWEWPEGGKLL